MRPDIKKLELKKLFKEFGFLKIDEEYKIEIQYSCGPEFEKVVHQVLKDINNVPVVFEIPLAKEDKQKETQLDFIKIDTKINNDFSHFINTDSNESTENQENKNSSTKEEIIPENKDTNIKDIKKLYRKVATKTHPDKVSIKYLNDLYLKAQKAYETNDIFSLYLICNDLDIEYEFPADKLLEFRSQIKTLRVKNLHVEQTYLWAWAHEDNEDRKKIIVQNFITQAYGKTF